MLRFAMHHFQGQGRIFSTSWHCMVDPESPTTPMAKPFHPSDVFFCIARDDDETVTGLDWHESAPWDFLTGAGYTATPRIEVESLWSDWDIPRRMMQARSGNHLNVGRLLGQQFLVLADREIFVLAELWKVALWIKEKNEETGECEP